MKKFELFDTVTKEEAKKVIEDLEVGDALAITNLLHTQTIKNNSSSTILFLEALSKINDIMIKMEEDEIEWDIEFNDLYRNFINFYNEKCLKIINEKEKNKMIKTWDELEEKYEEEERETMTAEREREFVNDLSNCYENEGFNKVFWSPYANEGEMQYYGKPFKVLGRTSEIRNNLKILPLWDIEFEDGKQLTVEPFEIFTKAMKDEGCPKIFLIDEKQEELNCLYARLMIKLQCELSSYKETLYRMTVDEVMDEAYKLTMLKEFIKVFEWYAKEELNANQFNFYLRMDNTLQFLFETWLARDSEEQEIYKRFLFEGWDWSM